MANTITRIIKGLFTNSSPIDQPQESYRYALNTVEETDQGDNTFRSNEESNESVVSISPGYIPIGKVYATNNRVILFSVSEDNLVSEIGIFNADTNEYTAIVNDKDSIDKLNFSVENQIRATYRLRRGCEDTVYWVDSLNKPRYFNFSKEEDFKTQAGLWDGSSFSLQRLYDRIPNFKSVSVIESGGNLEPGSYNFSIQYVDESLNPTEWIGSSPTVKIYNDITTKNYGEINGSINSESEYLAFPPTGKSIKIDLDSLDPSFPYYRIAIIASNNGSGQVNNVYYSEVIPTSKTFYIYTGNNHIASGTETEILQFTDIIETASFIEQLENRLFLGKIKGKQVNYCSLQKYASKITADCITKEVILNNVTDPANTKNAVHEFNNGLGYMPGEIYSFGIMWIFSDNSLSPVYHIPGKQSADANKKFTSGRNVYAMSGDNTSLNSIYDTGRNGCNGTDYWGTDYNNTSLVGKYVRHHRFPLRSKIKVPLITISDRAEETVQYYNLLLTLTGNLIIPVTEEDKFYVFQVRVDYKVDGEDFYFSTTINPQSYANNVNKTFKLTLIDNSQYHNSTNFTDIKITITDKNDNPQLWSDSGSPYCGELPDYFEGQVCTKVERTLFTSTTQERFVKSNILGIKFSNIQKPDPTELNGLEVIGYYIVRNERTEFEKTILDSGILTSCVQNEKYISNGLFQPETNRIYPNVYGFIHPEHKFNNKHYTEFDRILYEGDYIVTKKMYGKVNYDDVYDGSSFDSKNQKGGNDDGEAADGSPTSKGFDGWSFNLISRDNILDFKIADSPLSILKGSVKDVFYLDALDNKLINDGANVVYNIAADNKVGFVQTTELNKPFATGISYVQLYKINSDPYSNFRILPYYSEMTNPAYFGNSNTSERSIFNGDSYISPMRYVNTMFWDNRVADRQGKKSFFKALLGIAVIVIGAALVAFTGGASTLVIGAGIAIAGGGALIASSGIKQAVYNKVYNEEYNKGLRKTVLDDWVDKFYNYKSTIPFGFTGNGDYGQSGPSDDTIQWIADCLSDVWIESSVNMNLRNRFYNDLSPTFLNAPSVIESGNDSPILTWDFFDKSYTSSWGYTRYPVSSLERHVCNKLLAFDETRDDNRYYIGVPLGEYYNVNPDYLRRNKQKIYYHLASQYDCCSDCLETFPHRIFPSQQSFQEELSDNFRIFLPNSYVDIEGETGELTNLYRIGSDLFAHTEEALWNIPRNYQERITDQIVSFIGTGEYLSIPPRKIVDDDTGISAGCRHSLGAIKTPVGIIFPCVNQNSIFQFDGRSLRNLSNIGMSSWFKNNMPMLSEKDYLTQYKVEFPYRDNPSNPEGSGFISVFDSRKNRVIITKKDFSGDLNNSWTLSYSLKTESWTSFHSYLPYFYIGVPEDFYSLIPGNSNIYKHNRLGHYQNFYGKRHPFILEFVSLENPVITKIWDYLELITEARKYDKDTNEFAEQRFVTFNKGLFYNSRQSSGVLNLIVKDTREDSEDYLLQQVENMEGDSIIIDRSETNWSLNQLRDIVVDYTKPLFNSSLSARQDNYFTDKIVNKEVIDYDKDWSELESFRDKYLVVRLIFDNFDDIKLIFNYSIQDETQSFR